MARSLQRGPSARIPLERFVCPTFLWGQAIITGTLLSAGIPDIGLLHISRELYPPPPSAVKLRSTGGVKLSVAKTKAVSKIRGIARRIFWSIIASCFCKTIECLSSSIAEAPVSQLSRHKCTFRDVAHPDGRPAQARPTKTPRLIPQRHVTKMLTKPEQTKY